jgi:hypothetical protein
MITKQEKGWLIGVGVVGVLTALYFITKPKKDKKGDEGNQETPDAKLNELVKAGKVVGATLVSKIKNVKLRHQAYVNDGAVNNRYGEAPEPNMAVGQVLSVVDDLTKNVNPATGKPYKWFRIKIDKALYDEIQTNQRSWWTREKIVPAQLFVREDTVKI